MGESGAVKPKADPLGQAVADRIDIMEGKKPAAEAQVGGQAELTNEQRSRLPYIVALARTPCYLCEADPPCAYFLPFKTADIATPWRIISICKSCRYLYFDVYQAIHAKLREELNDGHNESKTPGF